MATKKKFRFEHLSIVLIAVLLVVSVVINLTSAYFTDSASVTTSNNLVFGTIAINVKPGNGENFETSNGVCTYSISADDVARKATLYKLIVIENRPDTLTQPFYMRVKLSFQDGDTASNLATFSIASSSEVTNDRYGALYSSASTYNSSNWTAGNGDGKLYYNSECSLSQASSKIYIPVIIRFDASFGSEDFTDESDYHVQLVVEVIQSANNGYTGWSSDGMPASNWPTA